MSLHESMYTTKHLRPWKSSCHNRYTLQCVFVTKAVQEYLKVSVATDKTTTVQVFEGTSEGTVDHG